MMCAISVKQPWAQAIAQFGKHVENRSRRPPAHLIGQRVAIHVSQADDTWKAWRECWDVGGLLDPLLQWAEGLGSAVPDAGRIIATARLVGICGHDKQGDRYCRTPNPGFGDDETLVVDALDSPWFTGPVGWVLADVRMLREPVGQLLITDSGSEKFSISHVGIGPIRGQVFPFPLSPEVEAAVLAQEVRG